MRYVLLKIPQCYLQQLDSASIRRPQPGDIVTSPPTVYPYYNPTTYFVDEDSVSLIHVRRGNDGFGVPLCVSEHRQDALIFWGSVSCITSIELSPEEELLKPILQHANQTEYSRLFASSNDHEYTILITDSIFSAQEPPEDIRTRFKSYVLVISKKQPAPGPGGVCWACTCIDDISSSDEDISSDDDEDISSDDEDIDIDIDDTDVDDNKITEDNTMEEEEQEQEEKDSDSDDDSDDSDDCDDDCCYEPEIVVVKLYRHYLKGGETPTLWEWSCCWAVRRRGQIVGKELSRQEKKEWRLRFHRNDTLTTFNKNKNYY